MLNFIFDNAKKNSIRNRIEEISNRANSCDKNNQKELIDEAILAVADLYREKLIETDYQKYREKLDKLQQALNWNHTGAYESAAIALIPDGENDISSYGIANSKYSLYIGKNLRRLGYGSTFALAIVDSALKLILNLERQKRI